MTWTRSSRCADAACVEVRLTGDTIEVRDSKLGDTSPTLTWSVGGWKALLSLIVARFTPGSVHHDGNRVELRGPWLRGGMLTFTPEEWATFEAGVRAGEFDPEVLRRVAA